MNASIKYFLTVSIFLIGMCAFTSARAAQENVNNASSEASGSDVGAIRHKINFVFTESFPGSKKENHKKIEATENKVEEDTSEDDGAHDSMAMDLTRVCLIVYGKKFPSFYKYFSRGWSCRYLMFQVFRI